MKKQSIKNNGKIIFLAELTKLDLGYLVINAKGKKKACENVQSVFQGLENRLVNEVFGLKKATITITIE